MIVKNYQGIQKMEKILMDVYEASKYLKLSPNTIYQWKYEEKIPSIKLGGKLLFDRNELDDFIDNLSKK
ncbi:TPA: hypothetical protein CPT96_08275 [Candidatus Gastranaerophilales bacterium HUM_10]|nr:MAG TPA: hypothetical protein CPT96_08275 [Candidatus Gastranaerophilales bacterium HUM_10]